MGQELHLREQLIGLLFRLHSLVMLELLVRDYISVAEADCVSLPGKEALFVKQASDAIHLDYVLDVLLHLHSLNSHPELTIALDPLS